VGVFPAPAARIIIVTMAVTGVDDSLVNLGCGARPEVWPSQGRLCFSVRRTLSFPMPGNSQLWEPSRTRFMENY